MTEPLKTHATCPECGSKDAFSWFEKGKGYCHGGCGGKWIMTEDYIDPKRKEPSGFSYEEIRGLDPKVAEKYGIVTHTDEKGKPFRYAFKYPNNTKYRGYHDKTFWFKDSGVRILDFFGPAVNPASSKRLYITEGEFDAASLYQSMDSTWPVLSLPSASIGDDFVKKQFEFLNSFQEVVYAGELDKAGRKAAERLYKALPHKFYYVPLTKWKDANEALMAGQQGELKWSAFRPQRWTPDNFFCSDNQIEQILKEENPYEYVPTGIEELDEKIRGIVKGGLTFLMAPPGSGKTEIFRKLETGLLMNSTSMKIALLHTEEQKSTTYRAMATYKLGVNVRTKEDAAENKVSEEDVIKAAQEIAQGDRTIVFEMKSGDDPMEILSYVRLAASVYGADYVFVDHVQRLAYMGGVEGATNVLTRIASNLAQIAKELNIGVIMISHVNEDGHAKYAKSLEEEAIMLIKIERDKENTDEEISNTTKFIVTKNRPFSKLGYAGAVYYDPKTTIISEVKL